MASLGWWMSSGCPRSGPRYQICGVPMVESECWFEVYTSHLGTLTPWVAYANCGLILLNPAKEGKSCMGASTGPYTSPRSDDRNCADN